MQISKEQVRHVAKLARLEITEEEQEAFRAAACEGRHARSLPASTL